MKVLLDKTKSHTHTHKISTKNIHTHARSRVTHATPPSLPVGLRVFFLLLSVFGMRVLLMMLADNDCFGLPLHAAY